MPDEKLESSSDKERFEEFRDLYSKNYGKLVYYFTLRGVGKEDARDLAQETFLRAHRGWASFRGEASKDTWLVEIARNRLKNWHRDKNALKKGGTEVPFDDPLENFSAAQIQDPGPDILETAINSQNRELLLHLIAELPQKQRDVVTLRLRDSEYHEISTFMGISIETVKSHLYQARERLRKQLGALIQPSADGRIIENPRSSLSATENTRKLSDRESQFLELYRAHGSMRKVAEIVGYSAMTVSKVLSQIPEAKKEEAGVKIRDRGYAQARENKG